MATVPVLRIFLTKINQYITIHQHNPQRLVTETIKVKIRIALIIMDKIFIFVENNNYNLRSGMHLNRVNVRHLKTLKSESEGSRFKSYKALGQAKEPNLIMRLLVTLRSNM